MSPKSTFGEYRPLNKFLHYVVLMSDIIEEAIDQEVWRKAMVNDYAREIVLGLKAQPISSGSSINIFLTKREC